MDRKYLTLTDHFVLINGMVAMSNQIQEIMETLFENKDFILKSTGHDYDFVGIIETKSNEPLTFFFSEELCEGEECFDCDSSIDESQTKLLEVYRGLKEYNDADDGCDEEEDVAMSLCADSYFRTRDDRITGFLSEPRERGQFLALIKNYCPEKLERIAWA